MSSERIQEIVEAKGLDLEAVFGPGTTLADLATCAHHLDTCGCVREFLWSAKDHREDRAEVPVSTPNVCEHHQHLTGNIEELHQHILLENRHKNEVLLWALQELPENHLVRSVDADGQEGVWFRASPMLFYDPERELYLHIPGLSLVERANLKAAAEKQFQARKAKVV